MPRQVILFLAETQSANWLGCHDGNAALRTPCLDRLASQGALFERAYTCSPVCGPARSAIFTGLYPHSNGVLANDLAPHADVPTVGKRLSDAGVRAGYIGKWHLDGTDYFGDGRCPQGWDPEVWFDGRRYLESLPNETARDLSRRELSSSEVAEHGITAEFTYARRIGDRAREFIARHKDEDFLLVVAPDEPHHPFICPEPFVSGFDDFEVPVGNASDALADKPLMQREWAEHTKGASAKILRERDGEARLNYPAYFACNSFLDSEVGRVMDAVDEYIPEALVLYTADHGDMFGSHRLFGKGPAVYEEITNVPFLVRWPGVVRPGSRNGSPLSQIDLTPTLLSYFDVPIPNLLQGTSLLERFEATANEGSGPIFLEFNRFEVDHDGFGAFAPIRCVIDGRWKLAVNLLDIDELYDLESDPGEMRNRIADESVGAIRDALHGRLLEWMDATRDPLRGPHWRRRAWGTANCSSWGGPTRPRPFDAAYFPKTLLYDTAREVDRAVYAKH